MASLRLVRGISGAGKSSFAIGWAVADPANRSRVSRDDIRTMLYGYPGNPIDFSREEEVTAIEEAAVRAGLKAGKDVLVDATHLRAKYIRKWNDLHPLTEVIDFEVDVDEAVRRDAHRLFPVGEVVIREMAQKFLRKGKLPPLPDLSRRTPAEVRQATPHDPYKTDAIVVDVDNTLAHLNGRGPYDTSLYHTDTLDESVAAVVRCLAETYPILITSGRSREFEGVTRQWLTDHHIPFDRIIMRATGDTRNDSIVKQELYWEFIEPEFNVTMIFDDRDRVIRAWRGMGLKAAQVEYGNF